MKKNKIKWTMLAALVMLMVLLAGCGQQAQQPADAAEPEAQQSELLISAAASLTDVMTELSDAYAQTAFLRRSAEPDRGRRTGRCVYLGREEANGRSG